MIYYAFGLVGQLLHIIVAVMNPKSGRPNTFSGYFQEKKVHELYGLISYGVLMWLWDTGEIFEIPKLLSIVGIEYRVEPIEVNFLGAFLLGYFASSIMPMLTYLGEKIVEFVKSKIGGQDPPSQ